LLVSPSNPLGYHIPKEVCLKLDEIAQAHGKLVVIDDVLRGNLPLGKRESIASYFSQPYVVDGFSHRFGEQPLGEISYILVPEGDKCIKPKIEQIGILDELLRLAYEHASGAIIGELEKRNQIFDDNIRKTLPAIKITRPSGSSIISVINLPDDSHLTGKGLYEKAHDQGVLVYPVTGYFPPKILPPDSLQKMARICLGATKKHEDIALGAQKLGEIIRYESRA
jgi:DNA-binding transcriptional MocR family regulator